MVISACEKAGASTDSPHAPTFVFLGYATPPCLWLDSQPLPLPDSDTVHVVISACETAGAVATAVAMLRRLEDVHVRPPARLYAAAIRAAAAAADGKVSACLPPTPLQTPSTAPPCGAAPSPPCSARAARVTSLPCRGVITAAVSPRASHTRTTARLGVTQASDPPLCLAFAFSSPIPEPPPVHLPIPPTLEHQPTARRPRRIPTLTLLT